MTRKEAQRQTQQENRLLEAGVSLADAEALRRISMTLHRWAELECGMDHGCIERDETTGKAYWLDSRSMRRTSIADRERGALRRLTAIMARYPQLEAYVQGDPRGAALYVLTEAQRGDRAVAVGSIYNRGIVVY